MLKIENLNVYYGVIHAIKNVTMEVGEGEIVSLIGANGAGKTTILHTITGLQPATSGSIVYDGHNLIATPASKIISLRMAHVPEGRHIFPAMSVLENLKMGAFIMKDRVLIEQNIEQMFTRFPRLRERSRQLAGTLSGGEQQMLAMARALMTNPKIVLMDEPSMGLSPLLVKDIFNIIKELHTSNITILLVEQNAKMALAISDRAYVLENGEITLSGDAKILQDDPRIREAYLGAK